MSKIHSHHDWFDSRQPLYLQLATIFRLRIENGLWPVGEQISTIEVLMREFGVGRVTVRAAISELEKEGLLVSARGRGTFVKELPKTALPRFEIGTTWEELVARGSLNEPLELQLLGDGPGALPEGIDTGGPTAPAYQGLGRVYTRRGIRVCYSRVYLEAGLYKTLEDEIHTQPVITVLGNRCRDLLRSGTQVITFIPADDETAAQLRVPVGASIAQIVRHIRDKDGLLVYWGCVHYDARYLKLAFDLFRK